MLQNFGLLNRTLNFIPAPRLVLMLFVGKYKSKFDSYFTGAYTNTTNFVVVHSRNLTHIEKSMPIMAIKFNRWLTNFLVSKLCQHTKLSMATFYIKMSTIWDKLLTTLLFGKSIVPSCDKKETVNNRNRSSMLSGQPNHVACQKYSSRLQVT